MKNEGYLRVDELCRHYQRGAHVVRALDGVTLTVERGEFISVVGSSGSGKTTLLNLMAGLAPGDCPGSRCGGQRGGGVLSGRPRCKS